MLLSCFPSQVRLLGQNFTGHVHGTGRDKAARYPVKLTVCETIRTFLQPERPLNRRIRIWHDSYTGPTGQRGTRSHRPDRVRTRYVLFCNPNSRSTDGSEFGMSRTRDRRTTGHPSQRLGKARVTGETGGLHMISYANPPISHTQAGRSPLLPNIPEGFSPPWDPCPSFVKKGYTVFPRIPVYTFFGPYGRTCIRPCHVHGFHPFSMVRAQFFETRPPCPFFPISSRSRFLARVAVRAPVHATHMVFTSFPWCAPSFLQHGRRTPCFPVSSSSRFLARVPVRSSVHATNKVFTRFPWRAQFFATRPSYPVLSRFLTFTFFGPCARTCIRLFHAHGLPQFSMVRAQFIATRPPYPFFPRFLTFTFFGPCARTCIRPCHAHGLPQFSMVRAQFFATRPSYPVFPRFLKFTFFGPCARTFIRPCHAHAFHPFSMARAQFFAPRPSYPVLSRFLAFTFFGPCARTCIRPFHAHCFPLFSMVRAQLFATRPPYPFFGAPRVIVRGFVGAPRMVIVCLS